MSYPESSYDGADGSREQDMDEADYRLKELNLKLSELEEELELTQEGEDDMHLQAIQDDIFTTRGQITDLKNLLGITEF